MSFSRQASARLAAGSHSLRLVSRRPRLYAYSIQFRTFADNASTEKTVFPGSQSTTKSNVPPPPSLNDKQSATSTPAISPAAQVPKLPDASPRAPVTSVASPPSNNLSNPPTRPGSTGGSNNIPPGTPKARSRLTRFFFLPLAFLSLSYALGVYISLVSDNFHDFFTENIPFGEDAVLYFEEREFRRRFGDRATSSYKLHPQTSGERKVTVSGKSGVSAQVSSPGNDRNSDTAKNPSQATQSTKADVKNGETSREQPDKSNKEKETSTSTNAKSASSSKERTSKTEANSRSSQPTSESSSPHQSEPSKPSITPIELLKLENASDPVTQEVTKMLNDIITTINADNASKTYEATMTKARESLQQLSQDISQFRSNASRAAEEQVRQTQAEYSSALHELEEKSQRAQQEQQLRWREEYEEERQRLSDNFENKLDAEIQSAQMVADQRLRNELLEQQVKLNNAFNESIRDRVESERGARLGKLNELSASVSKLESLTATWGNLVEANVKTQHFLVAVEALRSVFESTDKPRSFLHEMAALKDIASDDKLVSATLASISPDTYQNGLSSSSNLIDRFRRVAAEVRKAALLPEHAGAASHAASFFLSKLMFKKEGLALGDDVESVLSRAETLLEEGNLDEAAREMNGLEGWARVLSKDWLAECRRVLEARQALDILATEARLQSLTVR